jgi:ribose-phosphate pyrophosphokinase
MNDKFVIFGGTSNAPLSAAIARELGVELGASSVTRHPDGETSLRLEQSVRQREVFIVQATSPPVNDHLVELLAFADACRRDGAARVVAVVPYFGYARSDNRHGRRVPVMASLVAACIQAAGVDQLLTVDVHTPQIEGFFRIPVDNLRATAALCHALREQLPPATVVISPDAGRIKTANEFAEHLGTTVAILDKERISSSETRVRGMVGEVQDRPCLIVDDMIATGGTLAASVEALRAAGARPQIFVAATHGLLVGDAHERLARSGVQAVFVSDSVPVAAGGPANVHVISIAPLLAAAIRQLVSGGSLSELCGDSSASSS